MQIKKLRAVLLIAGFVAASADGQNSFPPTGNASIVGGNLGIGTATPGAALVVWGGDLDITGTDFNGTAHITSHGGVAYYGNNAYTNGIAINPAGQVGIDNASPLYPLDVSGAVAISGDPVINEGTLSTPADGTYVIATSGRIHGEYAVTFDSAAFRVQTVHLLVNANQFDAASTIQILENHSYQGAVVMSNFRLLVAASGSVEYLVMDVANRNGGTNVGVRYLGSADYPYGQPSLGGTLTGTEEPVGVVSLAVNEGNVGVGTITPGAKLEVNGNVKLTIGSGASITFPDNSVQNTAWNGKLTGADYAESVDVMGDRTKYEPGDVLVIDPGGKRTFVKSATPYAKNVMGVYSTKPGVLGRPENTSEAQLKEQVPMAMIGIVPTKVSAENGPIIPGDMLVSASTPGYAMKGTDRSEMFGAVIGKALGSLDMGTGLIEVAVSLQ